MQKTIESPISQPCISSNWKTKSFVANFADCLQFSSKCSDVEIQTISDLVLNEMNERARQQLERDPKPKDSQKIQEKDDQTYNKISFSPSLRVFNQINRSPPESRYSATHNRNFSRSASLQLSPNIKSKRISDGETSPSKRRRNPDGQSLGIPNTPTKPLQQLNLDQKNRLMGVSQARQLERQKRDYQLSPRRRLLKPLSLVAPDSIQRIPSIKRNNSSDVTIKNSTHGAKVESVTQLFCGTSTPERAANIPRRSQLRTPTIPTSQGKLARCRALSSTTDSTSIESIPSRRFSPNTKATPTIRAASNPISRIVTSFNNNLDSDKNPSKSTLSRQLDPRSGQTHVRHPVPFPRSQSMQLVQTNSSMDASSNNSVTNTASLCSSAKPKVSSDIPGYLRPTQATLRRSESTKSIKTYRR